MKVTYWSDFACPYCYIGETYLEKAIKELGLENEIELDPRAYELNPYASKKYSGPTLHRFAIKYGLSLDQAKERIEGISRMGREAGLDFNYIDTRYTSTRDAHRLFKWALGQDKEKAHTLQHLIFDAYFAQGLELSDHQVLLDLVKQAGFSEDEAAEVLASDAFDQAVLDDEEAAVEAGVRGVPYFQVGQYVIPGALSVAEMKKVLRSALQEEQTRKFEGMSCSIDGCTVGE